MKVKQLTLFAFLLWSVSSFAQETVDQDNYNKNIELTATGWDHINKLEYDQAAKVLNQAVELYDGNSNTYTGLATSLFKLGQYNLALENANNALSLSSEEADINYLAGNILMKLEKHQNAIERYNAALKYNGKSEVKVDLSNCRFNRGNAYLFSEQYESAIADYDFVLKNKVDFANAYHNRGIAYRHIFKKQQACDDFNAAVDLGSEKSGYYLTQYCKGIVPNKIKVEKASSFATATNIKFPDSVVAKLYYNKFWELNAHNYYAYYRQATIRLSDKVFVGSFVDYYPNGQVLLKGQYDSIGQKTGLFERYHENGRLYSKGNYKENKQDGVWAYYYEDNQLKEKIRFDNEEFVILEYRNENGEPVLENGTGIWFRTIFINYNEFYTLVAPFEYGKRAGKWKLKDATNQTILVESYKDGVFESGKSGLPGQMTKYDQSNFTASFFYPASFDPIEELRPSPEVYRKDYPFLDHLPSLNPNVGDTDPSILDENEVFDIVDRRPDPPGGFAGFYKYIGKNLRYPKEARLQGVQGRVMVQFVVDKDGSLTEIKVVEGIGAGCDEEAIRLFNEAEKWQPGAQKGRPVKVRLIMPITFKLG